ncbi:rhomboid family intramembrane serine protease [archaeon]|nr:rhomboid family intramembrane serine protease [archaeon]PJC45431.1 MAG: hypothetical protein CO037_01515 [Candidatus Pacearchaeota archaeon CG_4_9_14_0_2_um_filter_30_8]
MTIYQVFPNRKKSFFERMGVTVWLIVINVFLFILFYSLISLKIISWNQIALIPLMIFSGQNLWTLLTSMFMHAGLTHLIFNMISLFFLGILLEKIIGSKRYIYFYLFAGLFAGFAFVFFSWFFGDSFFGSRIFGDPNILGVGASGAIFGIVGVLSVLIPKKKISLIAGPLVAIILQSFLGSAFPNSGFSETIIFFLTFYIFFSIFVMFSFNSRLYKFSLPLEMPFWLIPWVAIIPLVIIGLFVQLPIANSAHFGGLIFGILYGLYLKKNFPNKVNLISRSFSQ